MGKLNAKQELFAQEYVKDLNATQAAIRAGYSARTAYSQGQRLLKHVDVYARVNELKAKRAEKLNLDQYWVLKRLLEISDRAMQAEEVMAWDSEQKAYVPTGEYQFDSNGANKATELIGKHIGMFDPKAKFARDVVESQLAKTKAETAFIEERTKILKGASTDSSKLDALIEAFKD